MFFPTKPGYFPASSPTSSKSMRCISKRALRISSLLVVLGIIAWCFMIPQLESAGLLPPLYQKYRDHEDSLPHYDLDAPYPNGRHAKYLFVANHQFGAGWGNVMQELLLNALLAFEVKRSFVFYNYEWSPGSKYTLYNDHLIPSTIPLSAIISGKTPLVGGPIDHPDVPRAVSVNYFRQVCPNRTIIPGDELQEQLQGATGLQIFNAWVRKLEAVEDPCVEIPMGSPPIFSYTLFGSKDVLDLWPILSKSLMVTELDWSPLIHSTYSSNRRLFETSFPHFPALSDTSKTSMPPPAIPGLLALHLRRGDFAQHCDVLAKWSSQFNGFNQFDELPDKFRVPPGGGWGENTPENFETYRQHCYPPVSQIVEKVLDVKRKVPGLNRVYIMTNGDRAWIDELTRALQQQSSKKWKTISSSRDLTLTWEQKFVAHAVDMYVAQRAHAFIGNGWSSLTSNAVMLRMAGKHDPNTTFFW
ncbi:hypothetical protein JOM56_007149 [Amanita muscaria]